MATTILTLSDDALLAEYIAYVYMIFVFSLTRRDMFRPGVTE